MVDKKYFSSFPKTRGRRLRNSGWIRDLTSENQLSVNDLVMPIFIMENHDKDVLVDKMPGIKRYRINSLKKEINEIAKLGIKAVALFPKIEKKLKSSNAREALNPKNLICRAIKLIREECPQIGIICDIALDPFTLTGHDGITNKIGEVDNDETLKILSKMAINFAEAGCKIIAPSDMMDGRVKFIRKDLEKNKFYNVIILSYSAKFCSQLYGPFRNALGNDKNSIHISKETYQLNFKNRLEAIKDSMVDIKEGADIIMVKPAGFYLDILREIKSKTYIPIAAFQVSGEYSMIRLSSEKKIFDYKQMVLESLYCIKRAGADIIFSYFSKEVAKWLNKKQNNKLDF